jgi:hypothetical protein
LSSSVKGGGVCRGLSTLVVAIAPLYNVVSGLLRRH